MENIIPDFFILGGAKCGTTSLAYYLSRHPNVLMASPKEPTFFCDDLGRMVCSWKDYNRCFSRRQPTHRLLGEASVAYLFSSCAVPNILRLRPDAKFIVICRNPVDMAYSLHSQILWSGNEKIDSFQEAWYAQKRRLSDPSYKAGPRERYWLQYQSACSLGSQVKRLYEWAIPDQILLLFFDDLVADPRAVYRQVLEFIGMEESEAQDFPVLNSNKKVKYPFIRNLSRSLSGGVAHVKSALGISKGLGIMRRAEKLSYVEVKREPLSKAFRAELLDDFRDEIQLLAELSGRDLSGWLERSHSTG